METEGLKATEAECAEGRTAPRVALADIEANIASEMFVVGGDIAAMCEVHEHPSLDVLTICLIVLRNGFTIIGKSAPADPRNFDAELGRKLAYEDAVRQIWPLMGYELRERLFQKEQATKFDRMDAELQVAHTTAARFAHEGPAPE